jgi:hypothetical protein
MANRRVVRRNNEKDQGVGEPDVWLWYKRAVRIVLDGVMVR